MWWDNHIESIVKKAQQRLYFLRQLRKFNLPQELLIQFYSAIIESVLCTSITVWFSSATKSDLRRLRSRAAAIDIIDYVDYKNTLISMFDESHLYPRPLHEPAVIPSYCFSAMFNTAEVKG